jgi:hypothetical protein
VAPERQEPAAPPVSVGLLPEAVARRPGVEVRSPATVRQLRFVLAENGIYSLEAWRLFLERLTPHLP